MRGASRRNGIAGPDCRDDDESVGQSLFGGKPLGIGLHPVAAFVSAGSFDGGKDTIEEAITMPVDNLGDPACVGNIGADTEDHVIPLREPAAARALPRSMAARIERTVAGSPAK